MAIALRVGVSAWLTLSCAIPAWRLPDALAPWHLILCAFGVTCVATSGALFTGGEDALRFTERACWVALFRSALLMAVWYVLRPDDATLWLIATHDTACYAWNLCRRPRCGWWTRASLALFGLAAAPPIARTATLCQMPWDPLARASLLALLFNEMADAIAS